MVAFVDYAGLGPRHIWHGIHKGFCQPDRDTTLSRVQLGSKVACLDDAHIIITLIARQRAGIYQASCTNCHGSTNPTNLASASRSYCAWRPYPVSRRDPLHLHPAIWRIFFTVVCMAGSTCLSRRAQSPSYCPSYRFACYSMMWIKSGG